MTSAGLERVDKEDERREDEGVDVPEQKSKEDIDREIQEKEKEIDRLKKEKQKSDTTYKYKPAASVEIKRTAAENAAAQKDIKTASHFIIGDIMMMRFGS